MCLLPCHNAPACTRLLLRWLVRAPVCCHALPRSPVAARSPLRSARCLLPVIAGDTWFATVLGSPVAWLGSPLRARLPRFALRRARALRFAARSLRLRRSARLPRAPPRTAARLVGAVRAPLRFAAAVYVLVRLRTRLPRAALV